MDQNESENNEVPLPSKDSSDAEMHPMKLGQKSVKNLVGFLGDLKTSKILEWYLMRRCSEYWFGTFYKGQLISVSSNLPKSTDFCAMKLGQKSVKNLVSFLGDSKTPKFHSEITWTLVGDRAKVKNFLRLSHLLENNLTCLDYALKLNRSSRISSSFFP